MEGEACGSGRLCPNSEEYGAGKDGFPEEATFDLWSEGCAEVPWGAVGGVEGRALSGDSTGVFGGYHK